MWLGITHAIDVSNQTVRNRLREADLRPRKPVQKPVSIQYKRSQLNFARQHVALNLNIGEECSSQKRQDFIAMIE